MGLGKTVIAVTLGTRARILLHHLSQWEVEKTEPQLDCCWCEAGCRELKPTVRERSLFRASPREMLQTASRNSANVAIQAYRAWTQSEISWRRCQASDVLLDSQIGGVPLKHTKIFRLQGLLTWLQKAVLLLLHQRHCITPYDLCYPPITFSHGCAYGKIRSVQFRASSYSKV